MSHTNNTFRFIYNSSIIVINGSSRYAKIGYFSRRKMILPKTFLIIEGTLYYPIDSEMIIESSDLENPYTAFAA